MNSLIYLRWGKTPVMVGFVYLVMESVVIFLQSVTEQQVKGESLLAINKAGVHFLHPNTHVRI